MYNGGDCFDGIFHFDDSCKPTNYSIQMECGKLVDFDYWINRVFAFLF